MLAPRQIIFTAIEGILDQQGSGAQACIGEALEAVARAGVPLVLCSRGTRAQLDSLRRKIEHSHPFVTERGGGLFIPDGYFNLRLEGAVRCGRNFCVPFARPHSEAAAALLEIAPEAGANVVSFSQMSAREIARNSGQSTRDAELYRQREFSEIFFFTGETEKATRRFSAIARQKGWETIAGEPFWEFRGLLMPRGQTAVRYLMDLYRKALHGRQRSVGLGSQADDVYFLSATDTAVVLPEQATEFDERLLARVPRAARADQSGAEGWSQEIAKILDKPYSR
jgi:predicted mannosyl-3-phosphoglycerate phosphatase (HAD superfamily)